MPLYAVNQHLVVNKLKALDVGGSITIHAFGAYYGLAASMVLSAAGSGTDHHKNGASYTSDMTAMIGTIFLWLFWVRFTTRCSLWLPESATAVPELTMLSEDAPQLLHPTAVHSRLPALAAVIKGVSRNALCM